MILIGDSSDLQAGWIAGDSGAVQDFCLFGNFYFFGQGHCQNLLLWLQKRLLHFCNSALAQIPNGTACVELAVNFQK